MEKRASNTFVGGLNTDRHPLTSQNTELVDARNIDLTQVGEGYQLILQKREGNTALMRLHDYSATWDSTTSYPIGTYVRHEDSVYRSISIVPNHEPAGVSDAFWEFVPLVSAGLDEDFIPLALREFNNIAYIISVNPQTGEGELGTFPSPDYSQFVYQTGTAIPLAASVGPGQYDPTAEVGEFGFIIEEDPGVGTLEFVNAALTTDWDLVNSEFTIRQSGYTPDTYTLSLDSDEGGNLEIWYSLNGGADTLYAGPVTLTNLGDELDVWVKVLVPWDVDPSALLLPTPDNPHNRVVSVVSANGVPTGTVSFAFYSQTIFEVRKNGTIPWSNQVLLPSIPPAGSAGVSFDFRTNNILGSIQLNETLAVVPAWITDYAGLNPGTFETPVPKNDILFPYGEIYAALAFAVAVNPGPGTRDYTIRMTPIADGELFPNLEIFVPQDS